jgi:hypothetical protein
VRTISLHNITGRFAATATYCEIIKIYGLLFDNNKSFILPADVSQKVNDNYLIYNKL